MRKKTINFGKQKKILLIIDIQSKKNEIKLKKKLQKVKFKKYLRKNLFGKKLKML